MLKYELKLASFLLGQLFLRTNYNCGSAKLQKLVVIADLYYLHQTGKTLFDAPILVNICGFGLKSVAEYFPPYICGQRDENRPIQIADIQDDIPEMNPLYDTGMNKVSGEDQEILKKVFFRFGAYQAKDLGDIMNNMMLHDSDKYNLQLMEYNLREYLNHDLQLDAKNENEIALFIQSGN